MALQPHTKQQWVDWVAAHRGHADDGLQVWSGLELSSQQACCTPVDCQTRLAHDRKQGRPLLTDVGPLADITHTHTQTHTQTRQKPDVALATDIVVANSAGASLLVLDNNSNSDS